MSPIWRRRAARDDVVEERTVAREEVVEEEAPPPPRIWPWLLLLLLLVLAGGLAYWLLAGRDEKTTMPRVVGLTEVEARARLADANLEPDVDRRLSEREAGVVFAQVPGAGTQLDEGERVEVLVSSGLERISVPSVRDLEEREAIRKVEEAGFRVKLRRVFAGAPRGQIVEQEPRGGERARRGATVTLISSKGRNLDPVPDVLGLEEREAITLLRRRGFEPRIFDVPSPDPRGTVVAQQPQGGEQAPPDSRVRVNVSTGEQMGEPEERGQGQASGGDVIVPDVIGLAQTPALRRLDAAGLRGVVSYRTSDEPRGRVIDQFPAPDSTRRSESRVRVIVSSGSIGSEEAEVPDVVGEEEADATAALEDAGFRVDVIRVGDGTTVEDQQPEGGITAFRGATVTLFVG